MGYPRTSSVPGRSRLPKALSELLFSSDLETKISHSENFEAILVVSIL